MKSIVKEKYLPTGELVRKVKIEAYLEEFGSFKPKKGGKGVSTLWLEGWDVKKIKKVVNEASENVIDFKGNKFKGRTKDGGEVKTNIAGVIRQVDFDNSWRAMGIKPSLGQKIKQHYELTWHHLDDLDENLQSTMQLVITEIHEQTVPHIGSHAQIKELLKIMN